MEHKWKKNDCHDPETFLEQALRSHLHELPCQCWVRCCIEHKHPQQRFGVGLIIDLQ